MNGAAFLEALAACVGKAHVRCDEREIALFLPTGADAIAVGPWRWYSRLRPRR